MPFRYAEYDAFAWMYNRYWGQDSVQRFLPVIEKLVLPHLGPHARILDLCCGTGQLAQALAQRGYQVTGIDGSEEMIRYARINAPAVEESIPKFVEIREGAGMITPLSPPSPW
ncbi:MAG: methyltransferase domain-containing protein, partial [Armatimonadota bacterium]|nr:methyltransferase domain-containing protein [Armatimonadota bacterium]